MVLKRDFFPRLAKEHGVSEQYTEQVKVWDYSMKIAAFLLPLFLT